MIKLVALKKLRYPRGPDGKEYNAGDEFEALSERDAKALKLVRAAQDAPRNSPLRVAEPKPPPAPRVETRALRAEQSEPSGWGQEAEIDEPKTRGRRTYRRTDLKAED